ncbi:MAG: hypothetical protein QXR17_08635, partial [Candidatus Bathyarchaeia archaeon]
AEVSSKGPEDRVVEYVKSLMTKVIALSFDSVGGTVKTYIRKAVRTGAWRSLKPESRALLLALRSWKRSVKSLVLRSILTRILVEIELHTTRGKAIFYGILEAMRKAREVLSDLSRNLSKIIAMGIQYMNLPLLYRIHG